MHEYSSAGVTHWFVARADHKEGPLAAADIARMLEAGELDWDTRIWRDGLEGWTPIQGDHALVTAIDAVRGVFADTSVFMAPDGLVPGEDTVVEPTLEAPTQRVDTRRDDLQSAGVAQPPPLLGRELVRASRAPPPQPLDTGPHAPVAPRSPVPHSWMPSVRSMLLVAGLAFVFGVVVAALWGRLFRHTASREDIVVPALRLGDVRDVREAQDQAASAPTITPQNSGAAGTPMSVDLLRREVRRVSLDVYRCLPNPTEGVQVEVQIDARTGRPADVRVLPNRLSPGESTCVGQAVRQLQIPPFSGEGYRLSHRFAW